MLSLEPLKGDATREHVGPVYCTPWVPVGPERDWTGWDAEGASCDYVMVSSDREAALIREIAPHLMARWPCPVLIEYSQHDWEQIKHMWQVSAAGDGASVISGAMTRWGRESGSLTPTTDGLARQVRRLLQVDAYAAVGQQMIWTVKRRLRDGVTIPRQHLRVHKVAERQGSWTCAYCGIGLIDVCSDADIVVDDWGKRMIDPNSPRVLPTFDHLVPQALGGSHSLRNLVLACQSCNSSKGAR